MSFQQSSSSITAFPTTERGKESPSVESDKVSRAGTTGSQGAVQPSWPKKRAPTPEPATYRKRMCGPARDLVLGEPSKSGKSLVGYIRGSAQVTMGDFLNKVYAFSVSLNHLVACKAYLNEIELTSALAQDGRSEDWYETSPAAGDHH
ncbi:hypothetical protein RJZ90_004765 [Blastomyces dermatitidis]